MTIVQAFFIALLAILCSSAGQIILKVEDQRLERNFVQKYINPFVVLAYALMLIAFLMATVSLIRLPLTYAVLMTGIHSIIVTALANYFLDEELDKKRILGIALVALGIVVFMLPKSFSA